MIFKSINRIITQQNIYETNFLTITTDKEQVLINAVNNNFNNVKRIGCWFHLSQDLIREARTMGLLNSKNKKLDVNITYNVISNLSLLPLQYKGNLDIFTTKINK